MPEWVCWPSESGVKASSPVRISGNELVGRLTAIKARYPIAYADAFAVATAIGRDAVLLTGDPEILDGDPAWPTADLRS